MRPVHLMVDLKKVLGGQINVWQSAAKCQATGKLQPAQVEEPS